MIFSAKRNAEYHQKTFRSFNDTPHGQITTNFVVQSNYKKTDLDENRQLYVSETDDFYTAQLFFKDNKHISATINMSSKVYKEHEDEIMRLLESVTY